MAGGKTGQADVGAGQTTDKQLGKANQRGYNVLVLPKRDFGLWYQWRGAGGVREKEVAVKVKMNPGGKGTGDRWDQFVTDPWISKEPSPSEARTFWLEREVQSLRNTLAPVSHGNPFLHSECWSGLVVFNVVMLVFNPNPSRGPVSLSLGELVMFQRTGRVNPDLAEVIGRAFPGALCHGDRASSSGGLHLKECPGNLRGGSGDSRLQDDGACALNGAHPDVYPGNLLGGCGEVFSQDRAWQRGHGVCPDSRAHGGVCPDSRVSVATCLHPGLCHDHRASAVGALQRGVCHDHGVYLCCIVFTSRRLTSLLSRTTASRRWGLWRWSGFDSIVLKNRK